MKKELTIEEFFKNPGPLSEIIDNFHEREDQLKMAKIVNEAIEEKDSLIIEAGTGVGKTFSYLVPALMNGGKVVISTATKNLQDQLFLKDIPTIRNALKIPVEINILKGRSNYICQLRMENALLEGQFLNKEDAKYIHEIKKIADHSEVGEISEFNTIPETSTIWPFVTSTKDNCLGQDCEFFKSCFVVKARKKAIASEIVIVNHHLFFADFVLKDADLSEILPKADTVIFDEAHQIPQIAPIFLGENISTNQILYLVQDANQILLKHLKDKEKLIELSRLINDSTNSINVYFDKRNYRVGIEKIEKLDFFKDKINNLIDHLDKFCRFFDKYSEQDTEFKNLKERTEEIINKLKKWINYEDQSYVHWADIFFKSVQFNVTPISIADSFREFQEKNKASWIFTSATLAANASFDHFQSLMGLENAKTELLKSPFNYSKNAYLYVPEDMPDVSSRLFNNHLVGKIYPIILAAQGRTFILSTSIKSMNEIKSLLKDKFEKNNINYPILTQGESSKIKLLEQFKYHGNAILIGSLSFWEGVDVRGKELSLVIIDKLPFQSPGDPIFESKINLLSAQGINAFMTFQLPKAIISLKQGAGRLIRDEEDKGVLMICDSRIISKPYGRSFWQSLPSFKRTRNQEDVIDFLNHL
ncbi:MAG: helicase [Nitrosomonadales bacterium]|nr:helicase [Nitrosomonadales bacterium]|tara:strand:+ start:1931 stop:3865 length:1935 start_codon:yes stop_codon:yes gene_type:complete